MLTSYALAIHHCIGSVSSRVTCIHCHIRPPRVRAITFLSYTCHIYIAKFGQYWTSLCMASSSALQCLLCDFCSSSREFALDFLQIPPHDGHPCHLLTVPTAKPVVGFHHQVIAHAEHTIKSTLLR